MSNSIDPATSEWRRRLTEILPSLGHRNWIAVVDSAYPLQVGDGVEMLIADEDMIPVLEHVCSQIEEHEHVTPTTFVDEELDHLSEADAEGAAAYRVQLDATLGQTQRQSMPHEGIIAALNEAAESFKVVIIKTRAVLPYTSVFLRLECGYWDETREGRLRAHLRNR